MNIKPSMIHDILDVALAARKQGRVFNPLFAGPPGLGKSEIVQAWCKKNKYKFVDIRAAYLEAPDLIGFPSIEKVDGRQVTVHNIPEFWPDENYKEPFVVLLEEVNRGTTSVMNTFMQMLTDRCVHKYKLPELAIIVSNINPESDTDDVSSMGAALRDRFEIFNVEYDQESFLNHMKESNWENSIIGFVESGTFNYKEPDAVGVNVGSKYISPRTLSKLNTVLKAGIKKDHELVFFTSILGDNVGRDFYSFLRDDSPVLASDIEFQTERAIAKLKKYSEVDNYRAGMISLTVKSILTSSYIGDELLAEVVLAIPVDQSVGLINELEYQFNKSNDTKTDLLSRLIKVNSNVKKKLVDVVKSK